MYSEEISPQSDDLDIDLFDAREGALSMAIGDFGFLKSADRYHAPTLEAVVNVSFKSKTHLTALLVF